MKFSNFGFKKFINDYLEKNNIFEPTLIQEKVIPLIKKNQTVIGKSSTGTGKTFAFLLPILNNFNFDQTNTIQATIIVPTRELAYQIFKICQDIAKFESRLTSGIYVGGNNIDDQIKKLSNKQPMIAICTPTRLLTLYKENKLQVTSSDYIVIDECDMVFEMNFADDIDFILSKCKKTAKKLAFSATISEQLKFFFSKYFKNSYFIDVAKNDVVNKNVSNILIWTKNRENKEILLKIIDSINPYICLIFLNKKQQIDEVSNWLFEKNIRPAIISANLEPSKRINIFKKVNNMEFKYVICTDLASRGIDIKGVSHIISIDLPKDLTYYMHRCGRTGRGNEKGVSYILHNSANNESVNKLKLLGVEFLNYKFIDNELINIDKNNVKKKKRYQVDSNISIIKSKYKKNDIKPGYKKKMNKEIEEYKRKKRREHIKESINKIKKEKYKKRRDDIFS